MSPGLLRTLFMPGLASWPAPPAMASSGSTALEPDLQAHTPGAQQPSVRRDIRPPPGTPPPLLPPPNTRTFPSVPCVSWWLHRVGEEGLKVGCPAATTTRPAAFPSPPSSGGRAAGAACRGSAPGSTSSTAKSSPAPNTCSSRAGTQRRDGARPDRLSARHSAPSASHATSRRDPGVPEAAAPDARPSRWATVRM